MLAPAVGTTKAKGFFDNNGKRRNSLPVRLGFLLAALAICYGWLQKNDLYLSAENGAGYWLGIVGSCCMLTLLLYPLRKKFRLLGYLGSVKIWFRIHMALGVIGPILVLYHASFRLGSINSNVALFCMITVAISGVIGRFIYTHIHRDLHGHKLTLAELKTSMSQEKQALETVFSSMPDVIGQLARMEAIALKRRKFLMQVMMLPVMNLLFFYYRNRIKRLLKKDIRSKQSSREFDADESRRYVRIIRRHIETTRKLSQLVTYEKLFSIWHLLHLPLFIMLIITGITHVIAVHMY